MKSVLIIGSGLAGMSAAVELTDRGYVVTVLEAHPYIGGRTASWEADGMEVESGLHRYLGFYQALPRLLKKVGVELGDIVQWEDEIEIRTASGRQTVLGVAPVGKPLKTLWGVFGNNDYVSASDKLALGAMFAAGMKDYAAKPAELDSVTVLEYAKRHHVSDDAVTSILIPITEGIFFVSVEKYSMFNLMGLFVPLLPSAYKLGVGGFKGGMSRVLMQPMADFVSQRSGKVLTEQKVQRLILQDKKVAGAATERKEYLADHTILATSLKPAQDIILSSALDRDEFADMLELSSMPAVTFQIEFVSPVMPKDRVVFGPGTFLASFSEQSRTTFKRSAGRLSVILARPDEFIQTDPKVLLKLILRDLKKLNIEPPQVVAYRKGVLAEDFYSLQPGSESLRPAQRTSVAGLTLAGDYTRQPHLATMEGAVVSGSLAADVVQKALG